MKLFDYQAGFGDLKGLGKGVFWICDNVGGNLVSLRDVWMGIYRSED